MIFAAPVMAALGALGALLPVAVHLFGRDRPPVQPWPSLMLLAQSHRVAATRTRLRHLLLLAARALAIALFGLALARPRMAGRADPAGPSELDAAGVLVVDRSASMRCREGDGTRFARGVKIARELVGRSSPGSRLALVAASARAETIVGRVTLNHGEMDSALANLSPSWEATDIPVSLRAAGAVLERSGEAGGTVFLVTDLARHGWYGDERVRELLARGVTLCLVDVRATDAANGAVLSARPSSARASPHSPVRIAASVRRPDRARGSLVELVVDGRKVAQRIVEATGAGTAEVEFVTEMPAPGAHRIEVRLADADRMEEDNVRVLVIESPKGARILLVDGAPPSPANGPARRRLSTAETVQAALGGAGALAPRARRLDRVRPGAFPEKLDRYEAVILAEVPTLERAGWEALASFVERGGGLIAFVGTNAKLADYARWAYDDFAPHRGLLPGRPGRVVRAAGGTGLTVGGFDHPVLAPFRGGANGDLTSARFYGYVRFEEVPADDLTRVLARFGRTNPALMEKRYGKGVVALVAAAAPIEQGDGESDLARRPCFVPFVHLLAAHVRASRAARPSWRVGQVWRPADAGRRALRALGPGEDAWVDLPGALVLDRPGFWTVETAPAAGAQDAGGADGRRRRLVAATLDPDESDLTPLDGDGIAAFLGRRNVKLVRAGGKAGEAVAGILLRSRRARAGRELAPVIFPLVVALVAAECLLANRLRRRRRPPPAPSAAARRAAP